MSVDGGLTWRRATGRANWTFSWQTGAPRTASIFSRAVDDSGNLELPVSATTVTVTAGTDTTAPEIVQTAPAGGAVAVPVVWAVTVTFNEPMDAATISGATVGAARSGQRPRAGNGVVCGGHQDGDAAAPQRPRVTSRSSVRVRGLGAGVRTWRGTRLRAMRSGCSRRPTRHRRPLRAPVDRFWSSRHRRIDSPNTSPRSCGTRD